LLNGISPGVYSYHLIANNGRLEDEPELTSGDYSQRKVVVKIAIWQSIENQDFSITQIIQITLITVYFWREMEIGDIFGA